MTFTQSALNKALASVHSFAEFEKLKQDKTILQQIMVAILQQRELPFAPFTLFADGTNLVFAYASSKVIKIFPPFHREQYKSEALVLKHLQAKLSVATPALEYSGEIAGWPFIIMNYLEGTPLEGLWETIDHANKLILMHELGTLIREVHALPTAGLADIDSHWPQFIEQQIQGCVAQHRATQLPASLLPQIPDYLAQAQLPQITRPVLLTGEYTPMNFLVRQIAGVWHIAGLIDFGDCMLGAPQYDLLGPGAFLVQGDKQLLRTFLLAYGYTEQQLTPALSQQLMALMLLHKYSNLAVQIRIKDWQKQVQHLQEVEDLVWGFAGR